MTLSELKFDQILIEDDFNVRLDMGDLESLMHNIVENGLKQPIAVQPVDGGEGLVVANDGHRRLAAIKMAIEKELLDPDTLLIPAIVETPDEKDRIADLIRRNDGKNLTIPEQAEAYSRLHKLGLSANEIAVMVGFSSMHVGDCLLFTKATKALKAMVSEGFISASLLIDLMKQHKPKDILEMLKEQQDKGANRVTSKAIKKGVPRKVADDGDEAAPIPTKPAGSAMVEMKQKAVAALEMVENTLTAKEDEGELVFSIEKLDTLTTVKNFIAGIVSEDDLFTWFKENPAELQLVPKVVESVEGDVPAELED